MDTKQLQMSFTRALLKQVSILPLPLYKTRHLFIGTRLTGKAIPLTGLWMVSLFGNYIAINLQVP